MSIDVYYGPLDRVDRRAIRRSGTLEERDRILNLINTFDVYDMGPDGKDFLIHPTELKRRIYHAVANLS